MKTHKRRWDRLLTALIAGGLWALAGALVLHSTDADARRDGIFTRQELTDALDQALRRQPVSGSAKATRLELRRVLSNCQMMVREQKPRNEEEAKQGLRLVGWLRC